MDFHHLGRTWPHIQPFDRSFRIIATERKPIAAMNIQSRRVSNATGYGVRPGREITSTISVGQAAKETSIYQIVVNDPNLIGLDRAGIDSRQPITDQFHSRKASERNVKMLRGRYRDRQSLSSRINFHVIVETVEPGARRQRDVYRNPG